MNKNIFLNNKTIFFILMLYAVLISVFTQNEFLYDLANYHYYNAWAFLNDRLNYDIVPGTNNTFFNPIIDLPLYFYIKYFNEKAILIYSLQGIWFGLLLFIFYKIYKLFFPLQTPKQCIVFALSVLIVTTGNAVFCQIGTATNEIPVAFFILWGFYILLKMIKFPDTQKWQKFLIAGLIMGIGLGLKQTMITFCIASGLTLIICRKYLQKPLKSIFWFALGGLIGYLIINGYFMWQYWILYGNPLAPFLNGVFHSPYFYESNFRDVKFLPSWKIFFIYPFLWNIHPHSIAEVSYYDIRLMLCYVIIWVELIRLFIRKKNKIQSSALWVVLNIFLFTSFYIWMGLFSMMRYAAPIEILTALYITKIGLFLYNKNKLICDFAWLSFLSLLIIHLFMTNSWGKITTKEHIYMEKIVLPENTLVEIFNIPSAFVIPEFAKYSPSVRAVGNYSYRKNLKSEIYVNRWSFVENSKFSAMRDKIEKNHQGPIVIIYMPDKLATNPNQDISNLEALVAFNKKLCELARTQNLLPKNTNCADIKYNSYDPKEIKLINMLKKGYFCRKLKNNLNPHLDICVPQQLKNQILGENNDGHF